MIADELKLMITEAFGYQPTSEQRTAISEFCDFLTDRTPETVMILRGSAGTGKTTLAGAIVRAMLRLRQKIVLLAPTGRAAKVFSLYAGHAAFTIHRRIYRQRVAGDLIPDQRLLTSSHSAFNLNDNLSTDT